MATTDVISNLPRPQTPPSSPELPAYKQTLSSGHVQLFVDLLKAAQSIQTAPATADVAQPAKYGEISGDEKTSPARASKVEFKTVNEVWNEKEYKYKIIESTTPSGELNDLDEYIFVVRVRIDKKTTDPTFFVDIKSEGLRDILRTVLRDVNGICLREDKPTIEQNLLYNRLTELEGYQCDPSCLKHFNLLVSFVKKTYASTHDRLVALLEDQEITYDLLWALFKPNTVVYTMCFGTGKPRCVKYNSGEERTTNSGLEYFHLECRYLDFDGKVFGETSVELGIPKFRGTMKVNSLDAFPLEYHPSKNKILAHLVGCGRKFVSLMGVHHRQYRGDAFYVRKGKPIKLPVNCRIMVDAAYFQEANPNYTRPRINGSEHENSSNNAFNLFESDDRSTSQSDQVKSNGRDPADMTEDDLILCSPTVPGFSYGNKLWVEFAVVDIKDINWNPTSFAQLAIPSKQKEVIQALAEAHISRGSDCTFDDFVVGKGLGLIILLHGLPGVGKTLTAEGISEHLQRPLYSISAGELGTTVEKLEAQLPLIFQRADKWNAVLLLDEADVFLEQRSLHDVHRNALVSVFLRELEYYQGIMFLTTNRVNQIDDAIASRIHLPLKYKSLGLDARRGIWESFLKKAVAKKGGACYSRKELDLLAEKDLNGRQIKNIVSTAYALASRKGSRVAMSHLEVAVAACEDFECDFRGAGHVGNMQSYV